MQKRMCWLPNFGEENGQKILHLQIDAHESWRPYTTFPQFSVPDYRIPGGSKGMATFQKLLKEGWEVVSSF
ncbi:MAG: hypothetical protein HC903_08040 [Methylacidiphilales bacterium]|nr:hypothetical protein [Candidatus Methylacidiphilales bacterium]NJR15869.1 hypothetical protein [Calothrix sp. CSU_2_0]